MTEKLTMVPARQTLTGIEIWCPRCEFRRTFGTERGAKTKLTEHMLYKHRVRPIWRDVREVTK